MRILAVERIAKHVAGGSQVLALTRSSADPRSLRLSLLSEASILLDHSLKSIKTHFEYIHPWAIADTDKVMARAVEEVATLRRVEIEEDARYNDHLLIEARMEEIQAVVDLLWQLLKV